MDKHELNELIENLVESKAKHLSTWKKVRWEGGRLYYETTTIEIEIQDFNIDIRLLYLEKLSGKTFTIQDNWPSSAPDITPEFRNWLIHYIAKLKIDKMQKETSELSNKKRNSKTFRKKISFSIKALLQREIKSKCPFCSNEDVDHFQIHHIDENPQNNEYINLLMLCPNCHSKITKQNISMKRVMDVKNQLTKSK